MLCCERLAESAKRAGLRTCNARGTDLERPYALGVARQLLVPAVSEVGTSGRGGALRRCCAGGDEGPRPRRQRAASAGSACRTARSLLATRGAGHRAGADVLSSTTRTGRTKHHCCGSPRWWGGSRSCRCSWCSRLVHTGRLAGGLGIVVWDPHPVALPRSARAPVDRSAGPRRAGGAEPSAAFTDACHHATAGDPLQ